MIHYIAMITGFVLDFFISDNPKLPHIVRFMGRSISFTEKSLRKVSKSDKSLLLSGFIIVILNISLWGGAAYFLMKFFYGINSTLGFIIESILFFQIFAKASLRHESLKVYYACKKESISDARYALSMIVGRDTDFLDFEHIIKADIETVAENMSDGIAAPWFYATLGAVAVFICNINPLFILVLPIIYKTINTMDSMIGYKNDQYFFIGKAGAKLDDIVNFIPSRLSALILLIVIFFYALLRGEFSVFKYSLRDFIKYRNIHSSPNAGQTESVIAGFFNTKLLGDASYFGKIVKKTSIGDGDNTVKTSDILLLNNIMYYAYLLLLLINIVLGRIVWFIL